jgi:hypothetical protein
MRFPYRVKDFKSVQKNFDYLSTKINQGRSGYGRWVCLTAGNAVNTGWTFVDGSLVRNDSNYFSLGTPPGTPAGVAASASSGVLVKQDGIYHILASLLCQGATVAGRYDAYLDILLVTGVIKFTVDQYIINVPAGSSYCKFSLMAEVSMLAGEWIWPVNATSQTYGDGGGAWSHMEVRYMGK